jgi:hypothetical protein
LKFENLDGCLDSCAAVGTWVVSMELLSWKKTDISVTQFHYFFYHKL